MAPDGLGNVCLVNYTLNNLVAVGANATPGSMVAMMMMMMMMMMMGTDLYELWGLTFTSGAMCTIVCSIPNLIALIPQAASSCQTIPYGQGAGVKKVAGLSPSCPAGYKLRLAPGVFAAERSWSWRRWWRVERSLEDAGPWGSASRHRTEGVHQLAWRSLPVASKSTCSSDRCSRTPHRHHQGPRTYLASDG